MNSPSIRPAAVAGMFYPGDPDRLSRDVDAMLDAAPVSTPAGRVRMILSPHAGYPYSGAIAAAGFCRLRETAIDTIVLIGPSHVEPFDFTSVFAGDAYETPLGQVAVNTELAGAIASSHASIRAASQGHIQPHLPRGEHGLEVQLPFLQRTHPHTRIVSIVMGSQSWEECVALGEALRAHCGPGVLILASSDLSHFHDDARARTLDGIFLDSLSTLDAENIYGEIRDGRCEACGAGPVIAGLLGTVDDSMRYRELARANSGDVTGDRHSVVGYASAVFESPTG